MGENSLTVIIIIVLLVGGFFIYNNYHLTISQQLAKSQQVSFMKQFVSDNFYPNEDFELEIKKVVDNYFEAINIKCKESGGVVVVQDSILFSAFPGIDGYDGLDIGCNLNGTVIRGDEFLPSLSFERIVCESETSEAIENRNFEMCSNTEKCTDKPYYERECKESICRINLNEAVENIDIFGCDENRDICSSFREGIWGNTGYTLPDKCISDIAHKDRDTHTCELMKDSRTTFYPNEDFGHILECKISILVSMGDEDECDIFTNKEEKAQCFGAFLEWKTPTEWYTFCVNNPDISSYFEACAMRYAGLCDMSEGTRDFSKYNEENDFITKCVCQDGRSFEFKSTTENIGWTSGCKTL